MTSTSQPICYFAPRDRKKETIAIHAPEDIVKAYKEHSRRKLYFETAKVIFNALVDRYNEKGKKVITYQTTDFSQATFTGFLSDINAQREKENKIRQKHREEALEYYKEQIAKGTMAEEKAFRDYAHYKRKPTALLKLFASDFEFIHWLRTAGGWHVKTMCIQTFTTLPYRVLPSPIYHLAAYPKDLLQDINILEKGTAK